MDGNCYILLWNLDCEADTQIAPGLAVRAIKNRISVFDLAAAGAVGFREWATLEILASECRAEIESSKDAAVTPGYDTLNRAWLASSMIALRGCGRVLPVAVSAYSWGEIAGFQGTIAETFQKQLKEEGVEHAVYKPKKQLPPFSGGLLDYRLKMLVCPALERNAFQQDDALWIQANFDKFNLLAADSEKFRFALEAAVDWRFAHDQRAAIARIWGGIEALLGIGAELVYRISISAASLLQPRGTERVKYAARVKRLYSIRSKAVHGDQVAQEKMSEALEESFVLLRELLFLIAKRGSDLKEEDIQGAIMS